MSKKKKPLNVIPGWFEPFQKMGIRDEQELFELLYKEDACVDLQEEIRENGFPDWALQEQFFSGQGEPQKLHISNYKGKYIFWIEECFVGDGTENPVEDYAVFDSLEEARLHRDSYPEGEKPLKEQILECKKAVGEEIWIEVKGGCGYHFNVKYEGNLLIEYLRNLSDVQYIKEEIKRYKEVEEKLDKEGAIIFGIWNWKSDRDWNNIICSYMFEVLFMGEIETYHIPIGSKNQHRKRSTMDYLPMDQILEEIRVAKDTGAYDAWEKEMEQEEKEWKEWQEKYDKAFQGIPHGEGITPIPLSRMQKKSLRMYLESSDIQKECDGTLQKTVKWCIQNIPENDRAGVLTEIQENGGYCDCEVLMNYL